MLLQTATLEKELFQFQPQPPLQFPLCTITLNSPNMHLEAIPIIIIIRTTISCRFFTCKAIVSNKMPPSPPCTACIHESWISTSPSDSHQQGRVVNLVMKQPIVILKFSDWNVQILLILFIICIGCSQIRNFCVFALDPKLISASQWGCNEAEINADC
jgi:hypothetical protein